MSFVDWLAILGIILALVFGIPTIPLFASGNIALGSLALILALVVIGLTIYLWWLSTCSPYTIISYMMKVDILDTTGKNALVKKTITLRPNQRGLDHYTHRNISADGNVTFAVDPGVTVARNQISGGDHHVEVRFPHQLHFFKHVTTWIQISCVDTFLNNTESAVLLVDMPIKSAIIDISFPAGRPPQNTKVIYRYSGMEKELPPPTVSGNQITWQYSRRPRSLPYGEHQVSCDW